MKKQARSLLLFVLFVMPAIGAVGAFAGAASAKVPPPPPPVNQNAPDHVGTACQAILTHNPNTDTGFNNDLAEYIFVQLGDTMGCFGG